MLDKSANQLLFLASIEIFLSQTFLQYYSQFILLEINNNKCSTIFIGDELFRQSVNVAPVKHMLYKPKKKAQT